MRMISAERHRNSRSMESLSIRVLIIATGAGHRHLGLENEAKLENKGVTYCATCDGALPMFRDKPLVVVGGGDSACEEATYLTRFASKVYLVHRRDELRASKIMADRAIGHEKIEMVWDSVVSGYSRCRRGCGHRGSVGESQNRCLHSPGLCRCFSWWRLDTFPIPSSSKDSWRWMKRISYRKRGAQISAKGVFVAGDCADQVYRQAITAAGMGCMAAIDASATSEN